MQVVIRFSLNSDSGSRLRNSLFTILQNHGIMWTGRKTATYEGNVGEAVLRDAMRQFWNRAASYMGRAHIDHFWMYCDKTGEPDADE